VKIDAQTVTVDGQEWFYQQVQPGGDRLPVVLLHGLVSQSHSWRGVMPALAEAGFPAIAPDWLGHGRSAQPEKRDFAYTPAAFEAALDHFLDALNLERVHLVAQGFLGSVGVQYALNHPDRVDRLAILNAPVTAAAKLPWKIRQLGLPLAGEMLTQDPLLVDRTLEGGGPYQVDDEDLDVYRRPFLKSSAAGRALLATVRQLNVPQMGSAIEQGLPAWDHPTLVLWGESDPWLPLELAKTAAAALPNGDLETLAEVGHYGQEDWADKVAEALVTFLRRQAL